jgi:hypothetical protein
VDQQILVVVGNEDIANCPLPSSGHVETNQIPNNLLDLQQTGQEPVCNSYLVIASSNEKVSSVQ